MWIESEIYREDLENIIADNHIEWEKFRNKNIFITGATGLIGSLMVNTFLYANMKYDLRCKVYAYVRNVEKAYKLFSNQMDLGLTFVQGDILDVIPDLENVKIDYIIHAASQTSSKLFVEQPVETISTVFKGTNNILEFAKKNKVSSMVFLSTMEVYGTPETDVKITENHDTNLVTTSVRNCYPISKRMAENLCVCYAKEYNINVKIARLTQTFGPGVSYNDGRVFAEFARCIIEKRDIILHTYGKTKRNYLYTADAVRGLLMILLNGQNAEAYNLANEDTYCSILEMAQLVAKLNKSDEVNVRCEVEKDLSVYGYAPTLHMNLDTNKVRKLGWKAKIDLQQMYSRLIKTLK